MEELKLTDTCRLEFRNVLIPIFHVLCTLEGSRFENIPAKFDYLKETSDESSVTSSPIGRVFDSEQKVFSLSRKTALQFLPFSV